MTTNKISLWRSRLPDDLSHKLRDVGRLWASSRERPRLTFAAKAHWDELLDQWVASDLPLAVRKSSSIRGSMVRHNSGRQIVICDNSPAQWAFRQAFEGHLPSILDIRVRLENNAIPFAFATKKAEKEHMAFTCTLSPSDNLNKSGWKLCHIKEIGLGTRMAIADLPIETLMTHFRFLMAPSNHFLVPLKWGGLGEIQEVTDEVRAFEQVGP